MIQIFSNQYIYSIFVACQAELIKELLTIEFIALHDSFYQDKEEEFDFKSGQAEMGRDDEIYVIIFYLCSAEYQNQLQVFHSLI